MIVSWSIITILNDIGRKNVYTNTLWSSNPVTAQNAELIVKIVGT